MSNSNNNNNNNNNNNANNINNTFNIKQHSQLQFDSKGLKGWMECLISTSNTVHNIIVWYNFDF